MSHVQDAVDLVHGMLQGAAPASPALQLAAPPPSTPAANEVQTDGDMSSSAQLQRFQSVWSRLQALGLTPAEGAGQGQEVRRQLQDRASTQSKGTDA
jgi:hypothetical protein